MPELSLPMPAATKRRKIREVVARELRSYIVTRGLKPGDRLPTEGELATKFGVSRLSLREATKALEFLGIVEARPGRGLTVRQVDLQRVTEFLGFHPALVEASLEELIESRTIVETGILPHVVRKMQADRSIYDGLKAINDQLRGVSELSQFIELDIAFHRKLIDASGIAPLVAFNDLLEVFFFRFRESIQKGEWSAGVRSHQKLIDALDTGNLEVATEIIQRHVASHKRIMGPKS
jgi:DNA-binding FadR family transcriptional regulator